jgi:hypothetical protein
MNVLQDFHKIDFLALNVRIFTIKNPGEVPGFKFIKRGMP